MFFPSHGRQLQGILTQARMIITPYSSSSKVNIYPICKLQKHIKGQK